MPESVQIRRIRIEGKEIGIDQLDRVLDQVIALHLQDENQIREELLRRIRVFNYVPTRKQEEYGAALLEEYRHRIQSPGDS